MNPASESVILAFLADRNIPELAFQLENWNHCLLRSYYDDETDFIYILSGYRATHGLNGKADLAGIYSHVRKALYAPCYCLSRILPTEGRSLQQILQNVESLATKLVILKVDGKPVPETDESASPWYGREFYMQHQLAAEARTCFYNRSTPVFDPVVKANDPSARFYVQAINHPDALAEQMADEYLVKNAKRINQRLWELALLTDKVSELEASPGEHHLRRQIAESVDPESMKMVALEILKEGKRMSCKMAASSLAHANDSDYSLWRMDAPGRASFAKLYGNAGRLFASDIQQISYKKKVLYERQLQA